MGIILLLVSVCAVAVESETRGPCSQADRERLGRECTDRFFSQAVPTDRSVYNINQLTPGVMAAICSLRDGGNDTMLSDFVDCMYEKTLTCVAPVDRLAMPGVNKTLAYLQYMCDNYKDLDRQCSLGLGYSLRLSMCVREHSPPLGDVDPFTPVGIWILTCGLVPVTRDCVKTAYDRCDARSLDILLQYYHFQSPDGCDQLPSHYPRLPTSPAWSSRKTEYHFTSYRAEVNTASVLRQSRHLLLFILYICFILLDGYMYVNSNNE